MTIFCIGTTAIIAIGLVILAECLKHAPLGYQDRNGFHLGEPPMKGQR